MNALDLRSDRTWSDAFGLSNAPLFGCAEVGASESHRVMLDGGHGTFALSIVESSGIDAELTASWMWSSDIPHHVAVAPDRVIVTRWDMMHEARAFSLNSVSQRFETFYRFLVQDRVQQSLSVVAHLVEQFRMVRTAIGQAGEDDKLSLGVFLTLLSILVKERASAKSISSIDIKDIVGANAFDLFTRLRDQQLAPLLERVRHRRFSNADLEFYSTLAVRHAGGLIFQESHFELMRTPAPDLFGHLSESTVKPITRGGAHFTPPSLARSVVDQVLLQFDDLQKRASLTLLDPACGSGAFLHEAIRGLSSAGFNGHLRVVGRDTSKHAIAMARFVLAQASDDWRPKGGITIDVEVADSLVDGALPTADIIVMNPPFVAVGSLDEIQQDHIDRILGSLKKGRADLSMAFILRAASSLSKDGALGCLFPASLLELQAAAAWRRAVHERASLQFLAMLGDHALFSYALVQVAAAVFKNGTGRIRDSVLTLWTADDKEVTGEALRGLHRLSRKGPTASEDRETWRATWVPRESIASAPSWRLRAPTADRLLSDLRDSIGTSVVDLFDVRQGILTGLNSAFILSEDEFSALSQAEKLFFMPALMNVSLVAGKFRPARYVFYPYHNGKLAFNNETELKEGLPTYYNRLVAEKDALSARASFEETWWALTRPRSWMGNRDARIVSKYFGEPGAFMADEPGDIAVVQGYAWFASKRLKKTFALLDNAGLSKDLVCAYSALLNSNIFAKLLSNFAPRVAGGQFNLSARYVQQVPIPDLAQKVLDNSQKAEVIELDSAGRAIDMENARWVSRVDELVASVYQVPLGHWK